MSLLQDGARENKLDPAYQNWLKTVPTYKASPLWYYRMGRYIYLANVAVIMFPLLSTVLLARKLGLQAPRFVLGLTGMVMHGICVAYQLLLRPLFGAGCGEVSGKRFKIKNS